MAARRDGRVGRLFPMVSLKSQISFRKLLNASTSARPASRCSATAGSVPARASWTRSHSCVGGTGRPPGLQPTPTAPAPIGGGPAWCRRRAGATTPASSRTAPNGRASVNASPAASQTSSAGLAEVAVDRGDQPAQPVRVELVLPAEFQQHHLLVRPSTRRLCASFTQRTTLPLLLGRYGLRCLRNRTRKPHLLLRTGPFGDRMAPIARSTRGTRSANSAAVRAVSGRSTWSTSGSFSSGAAPSRARADRTGSWSSAGRRRSNPPGDDCRRIESRSGSYGASVRLV